MVNSGFKKEYWYVELESHIRSIHASSGHYKTILITGTHYYQVVTRVNHLAIKLWVDYINGLLKANPEISIAPIARIGWLVNQKQYRRNLQKQILKHPKHAGQS